MQCHDNFPRINVPDFKVLSNSPIADLRLLRNQGLFLDEDKRFAINIMPLVGIPHDDRKFQTYLDNFMRKTDVSYVTPQPSVLQELIVGTKFVVNVICKEGRLLFLQVILF